MAALLAMAAVAPAASTTSPPPVSESEVAPARLFGGPTAVPSGFPDQPANYEISPQQALRVADQDPKVLARKAGLTSSDRLTASLSAEAVDVWEVGYYLNDEKVNLVIVDGETGVATESWTGSAVDWPMARGKSGQFGHVLNAPYVWIPLALVFLLGLWDFRRWRKWVHLDLLVLLSFGISQAFFNAAEIGVSVPLYYPPLAYLLVRMLWIGFRGQGRDGGAGEGLRPTMPAWLMTVAVIGLIALRLAGNLADSGVIDVGYAGVIGADKITHAEPIYDDSFPDDNPTGDTYGPANYFAYVPFEQIFPWSGSWDDLPAAHAAADLLRPRDDRRALRARPRPGPPPHAEPPTTTRTPTYPPRRRAAGGSAAGSRPGSPIARQRRRPDPRLRLGRLPLHRLRHAGQLQRRADQRPARLEPRRLRQPVRPRRPARHRLAGQVRAATPVPALRRRRARDQARQPRRPPRAAQAALPLPRRLRPLRRPLPRLPGGRPGTGGVLRPHRQEPARPREPVQHLGPGRPRLAPHARQDRRDRARHPRRLRPRRRTLVQIAALSAAVIIAVEITLEHWFYLYMPWFLGAMLLAMVARDADDVSADAPAG